MEAEGGEKVKMYSMSTYSKQYDKDIEITLMGVEKNSIFFDCVPSAKEEEAVITGPMAKKLKLKTGDEIILKDSYFDKEYTFKITAVCDYDSTLGIFMEREVLNKLLGADAEDFNCLVSNEKLKIDEAYLAKYLTRSDIIGNRAIDGYV